MLVNLDTCDQVFRQLGYRKPDLQIFGKCRLWMKYHQRAWSYDTWYDGLFATYFFFSKSLNIPLFALYSSR